MSIYKLFRSSSSQLLGKRLDEPTYLSFRLQFASDMDNVYNKASNSTANFDTMPHPLFDIKDYEGTNKTGFLDNFTPELEKNSYSTYQYLIDANEPTRAEMLLEFIQKFNEIQTVYPYYFQGISGIDELLKVNYTRGKRISNDAKITIKALDSIDMRMTYLLQLYKKIAWDDTYQRWILPDMMRFFTLKIYITEFRTFHTAKEVEPLPFVTQIVKSNLGESETPLYLSILDNILPVWEIQCEMCEFDITNLTYSALSDLKVNDPGEQYMVDIPLKIGNVKEFQIFPTFTHAYISDRKINGTNRNKEEISTTSDSNNKYTYPGTLMIAQSRENLNDNVPHLSTSSYNQNTNNKNMFSYNPTGIDKLWGTQDDNISSFEPDKPETWKNNAITWGKAFAKNEIDEVINKVKMSVISPIGLSFNEIDTAIKSKNIISTLGFIRKGINEVAMSYEKEPSQLLGESIETENLFKAFSENVLKSTATDEESVFLKNAINMALKDPDIWQQIKDFSLATDLIGPKEENIKTNIQYSSIKRPNISSGNIIINNNIIEGIQPSSLLNNKI